MLFQSLFKFTPFSAVSASFLAPIFVIEMYKILLLIIVAGMVGGSIYIQFGRVAEALSASSTPSSPSLTLPHSLHSTISLASYLRQQISNNKEIKYEIAILFTLVYIAKQLFSIPGSLFLHVLAGYLVSPSYSIPYLCILNTLGACGCYQLSKYIGKQWVDKYRESSKFQQLQTYVSSSHSSLTLFFSLLSLRIFPFTPNWYRDIHTHRERQHIHGRRCDINMHAMVYLCVGY